MMFYSTPPKNNYDILSFPLLCYNNNLSTYMQVTELSLPPNTTKITYEITPKGEIIVVKS